MEQEQSNPKLTLFEMTPVMVPYFIGFFVFRGVFVNFPIYLQITQGYTELEVVNIWAIFSGVALLMGALTRMPAGLLSDKIGRMRAYMLAYATYFIAMVMILFTTNNAVYLVLLTMIRLGLNLIAMSGRGIVSLATRDRALKNGLLSSMVGLGSFTGPTLLGFVLDNYPPSYFVWITVAVLVIDLVLFLFVLQFTRSELKDRGIDSDISFNKIERTQPVEYRASLRAPRVQAIFALFLLQGLVFGFISSVYSIYGFNVILLNATIIGAVTGLGSLVQAIWAPITGRLYTFIHPQKLRLVGWTFVLLSGISASLSWVHPLFFLASFFILNFGNATYSTVEITKMANLVSKREFSFIFGIATSLNILGTSIAGFASSPL
ncbi:MAG: MFS transporter, partial [Candidatus Kariarchaeaceae archaeon]